MFLVINWSTLNWTSQFMLYALINCCFYVERPNLESLSCRLTYFLCCGTGVAFLAFLTSKTKKTATHEFSCPSNPKKLKNYENLIFFTQKIAKIFSSVWPTKLTQF